MLLQREFTDGWTEFSHSKKTIKISVKTFVYSQRLKASLQTGFAKISAKHMLSG